MVTCFFSFFLMVLPGEALSSPNWVNTGSEEIQLGAIAIELNGNDFSQATLSDPIFLRILLGPDLQLRDTRVDLEGVGSALSEPIFLPVLFMDNEDLQITSMQDVVSIARWRQGEHEIWLKISTPSMHWLGEETSPKQDRRLRFAVGLSLEGESNFVNPFFTLGKANLASSQRESGQAVPSTFNVLWSPQRSESQIYLTLTLQQGCQGVRQSANPLGIILGSPIAQSFEQPILVARVFD